MWCVLALDNSVAQGVHLFGKLGFEMLVVRLGLALICVADACHKVLIKRNDFLHDAFEFFLVDAVAHTECYAVGKEVAGYHFHMLLECFA